MMTEMSMVQLVIRMAVLMIMLVFSTLIIAL